MIHTNLLKSSNNKIILSYRKSLTENRKLKFKIKKLKRKLYKSNILYYNIWYAFFIYFVLNTINNHFLIVEQYFVLEAALFLLFYACLILYIYSWILILSDKNGKSM